MSPQLPTPIFVSAVEREGWRPPCSICLPRYLTQGDGAPKLYGGGPVGRAPMRLRLMMGGQEGGGWAFRPSSLRIWARKGVGHPPHPSLRLRRSPAPQARSPRDRAGGSRAYWSIIITHTSLSGGRDGNWGVRVGGVGFLFFFPFFSWLVVLGPGSRVCVLVWIFCIACMQVRPPGEGARERRLPADSESSEFPRIDPASFSSQFQPSPAFRHRGAWGGVVTLR